METCIVTISFDHEKEIFQDKEFQRVLMNKKVKAMHPQFFQKDGNAYWTVFVEYETVLIDDPDPKNKKLELSDAEIFFFNKLRAWRKDKAEQEGVPSYVIATNRELIEVVRKKPFSFDALKNIKGFGKKKLERHGKELIEMVKGFESKKPVYGSAGKE